MACYVAKLNCVRRLIIHRGNFFFKVDHNYKIKALETQTRVPVWCVIFMSLLCLPWRTKFHHQTFVALFQTCSMRKSNSGLCFFSTKVVKYLSDYNLHASCKFKCINVFFTLQVRLWWESSDALRARCGGPTTQRKILKKIESWVGKEQATFWVPVVRQAVPVAVTKVRIPASPTLRLLPPRQVVESLSSRRHFPVKKGTTMCPPLRIRRK
jgi:hypothetical protein